MKKFFGTVVSALGVVAMTAVCASAQTIKTTFGVNLAGGAAANLHEMVSGDGIVLRGVVSGLAPGTANSAKWTIPGESATVEAVADAQGYADFAAALSPTFVTSSRRVPSTDIIATLELCVDATCGATVAVPPATTTVRIWDARYARNAGTIRKQTELEEALWYLHRRVWRYATASGHPAAEIDGYDAGTLMCGQAFVDLGNFANGDVKNPYSDDVARVVNFAVERLTIADVSAYDTNNPEDRALAAFETRRSNLRDGVGVYFMPKDSEIEFSFGPAARFIATCGLTTQNPAFDSGRNFSANKPAAKLTDWTYQQIAQQMVDWLAWAQLYEVGNYYPAFGLNQAAYKVFARPIFRNAYGDVIARGGWPYFHEGWGTAEPVQVQLFDALGNPLLDEFGNPTYQMVPADPTVVDDDEDGTLADVSITWWSVQGFQAADKKGLKYPASVKSGLVAFLDSVETKWAPITAFGPHKNDMFFVERAGQALSLYRWADPAILANDKRIEALRTFIEDNWCASNFWAGQDHIGIGDTTVCSETAPCYSHYVPNAYSLIAADGQTYWFDDLNVFAMQNVSIGLADFGLAVSPTCASGFTDYKTFYRDLLYKNQLADGGWDDWGWITGHEMGTAWAIQALIKL